MAVIKKRKNNKCWGECGKKGTFVLLVGLVTRENSIRKSLKTLKIELPYDPAIPFWVIHPKESNCLLQRYLNTHVCCGTIHTSLIWLVYIIL
jgi:hypothetical protein